MKKIEKIVLTPENCPKTLAFSQENIAQTNVEFLPIDTYITKVAPGAPLKKKLTANGWVYYHDDFVEESNGSAYTVKLTFTCQNDRLLTGLGQYEDGVLDYRGKTEYLYHSNMRCPLPVIISSDHYAIFVDTESDMIFNHQDNTITLEIGATHEVTYYVIFGDTMDEIVAGLRSITGEAAMMPRWIYGYIQSKERYNSSEELEAMAEEFRRRQIPIDCLVQDWYTWEEGKWGQKTADKTRYPDLPKTMENLHDNHVKLMWSIWPNMSETAENYDEFQKAGLLMGTSMSYNAYLPEGRKLYNDQCNREILTAGLDAWWCDNAEPFSDADWNGTERRPERQRFDLVRNECRKHMDWTKINSYCHHHAQGIFENFRAVQPEKRVVNLTRAIYSGSQQYGTILWSGDICARWDVMKKQIAEGLKVSLCGMPYWTLDIGAFFTVKDKYENRGCNNTSTEKLWFWDGDFNDGVADLGYVELYTRWIQFGAFLPMFRSHGTDTPREPWHFDNGQFDCSQIIVDFINLRYRLMPYIYSLGAQAHFSNGTIMRSLLFDFPADAKAANSADSYLFGSAFLVSPVTQPMYYKPNSEKIENSSKTKEVYLPNGTTWFDYFTNQAYEGGQTIQHHCPIDVMPLFVKAGSIVPISTKKCQYADENGGVYTEILVYGGADGHFDYFNDKGDGYDMADAQSYAMDYDDKANTLTLGACQTAVEPLQFVVSKVNTDGQITTQSATYIGQSLTLQL